MNNVKDLDCTKCLHRKMCDRKISHCDFVSEEKYCIKPREDTDNDIARFPKADVQEVKHGHWIKVSWWFYCSCCEQDAIHVTDYCPSCGAKMDEKENGNDSI